MIELLVAMTILNVALLAIVAVFGSSSVALRRASRISTASAVADQQMEVFRGLAWSTIGLDSASVSAADSTYKCDPALGGSCPNSTAPIVTAGAPGCVAPLPGNCLPTRTVTGPDQNRYRIDTYITSVTTVGGRATKQVTIVVRDLGNGSQTLVREASTFDQLG